jgi:hypothetical protein
VISTPCSGIVLQYYCAKVQQTLAVLY